MIVSGPSSYKFITNPAFFEMMKAITEVVNKRGYQVLLNLLTEEEEVQGIPRIAHSRLSDALILIGSRRGDEELTEILTKVPIPSLVVIREPPHDSIASVSWDNLRCGYMATKYLIEMGHRTIGMIGNIPGLKMTEERVRGYMLALQEAGIAYDEALVVEGDYYQDSGLVGIRKLLNQASKRPTAVFTGNDVMALGAMEGLEQEGIRIPEDISLIGCDNIPNLHLLKTPLTTISNPLSEMGRLAARKILGILEGDDELPQHVIVESELRIRSSVKRLGPM
nr:substrate-binding domain-containing protein [Ammoniphilus resinae]